VASGRTYTGDGTASYRIRECEECLVLSTILLEHGIQVLHTRMASFYGSEN